ncbi:MAG: hypothetical protein IPN50_07330 [Sphingomonadales bacterium]|nr:hypothetical protein [Sphingomonadales bacterium]
MQTATQFKLAASLIALAMTAGTAHAQDAAVPDEAFDAGNEIVVTAQKRSERLQDVPISMAAVSEETMTNNNVLTVQDLGRVATNFSATRSAQASSIRLAVRGIGAPGNTATEPSVAALWTVFMYRAPARSSAISST